MLEVTLELQYLKGIVEMVALSSKSELYFYFLNAMVYFMSNNNDTAFKV